MDSKITSHWKILFVPIWNPDSTTKNSKVLSVWISHSVPLDSGFRYIGFQDSISLDSTIPSFRIPYCTHLESGFHQTGFQGSIPLSSLFCPSGFRISLYWIPRFHVSKFLITPIRNRYSPIQDSKVSSIRLYSVFCLSSRLWILNYATLDSKIPSLGYLIPPLWIPDNATLDSKLNSIPSPPVNVNVYVSWISDIKNKDYGLWPTSWSLDTGSLGASYI